MSLYYNVVNPRAITAISMCYRDAIASQSALHLTQTLSQQSDSAAVDAQTEVSMDLPCVMTDPIGTCIVLQQLQFLTMVFQCEKFYCKSNWMVHDDQRILLALQIVAYWEHLTEAHRARVKAGLRPDTPDVEHILASHGFPMVTLHALRRFLECWNGLLGQWAALDGIICSPSPSTRGLEGLFGAARTRQSDDKLTPARYGRIIDRHCFTITCTAALNSGSTSEDAGSYLCDERFVQWWQRVRAGKISAIVQPNHDAAGKIRGRVSLSNGVSMSALDQAIGRERAAGADAVVLPGTEASVAADSPPGHTQQQHAITISHDWYPSVADLLSEFEERVPVYSPLRPAVRALVEVLSQGVNHSSVLQLLLCTARRLKGIYHHFFHPLKKTGGLKKQVAWGGEAWLARHRQANRVAMSTLYFEHSMARSEAHTICDDSIKPQVLAHLQQQAIVAQKDSVCSMEQLAVATRCLHSFFMSVVHRRVWLPLLEMQHWDASAIPLKYAVDDAEIEFESELNDDSDLSVSSFGSFDDDGDDSHDSSLDIDNEDSITTFVPDDHHGNGQGACACDCHDVVEDVNSSCEDRGVGIQVLCACCTQGRNDFDAVDLSETAQCMSPNDESRAMPSTTTPAAGKSGDVWGRHHSGDFMVDAAQILTPTIPRTMTQILHASDSAARDKAPDITVHRSSGERIVLRLIFGWLIRSAKRAREMKAAGEATAALKLLLHFDTSIGSALHPSVLASKDDRHRAGERLVRVSRRFDEFMLAVEDWVTAQVLRPSFLATFRSKAYLQFMAMLRTSAYLKELFEELVQATYTDMQDTDVPDAQVRDHALQFLLKKYGKSRFKSEMIKAGIRRTVNIGVPVRRAAHVRSSWHGNRTTLKSLKGEFQRNELPFSLTVPEKSKAVDMPWGIPFEFHPSNGIVAVASEPIVRVDAVVSRDQERLPLSYYSGGLEHVPAKEQRLMKGDKLLRIDGIVACGLAESDIKAMLANTKYPRVYEFVRERQRRRTTASMASTNLEAIMKQDIITTKISKQTAAAIKKRKPANTKVEEQRETMRIVRSRTIQDAN